MEILFQPVPQGLCKVRSRLESTYRKMHGRLPAAASVSSWPSQSTFSPISSGSPAYFWRSGPSTAGKDHEQETALSSPLVGNHQTQKGRPLQAWQGHPSTLAFCHHWMAQGIWFPHSAIPLPGLGSVSSNAKLTSLIVGFWPLLGIGHHLWYNVRSFISASLGCPSPQVLTMVGPGLEPGGGGE